MNVSLCKDSRNDESGAPERRRWPRAAVTGLSVEVSGPAAAKGETDACTGLDISEGGMRIECRRPFEEDTTLSLRFALPDSTSVVRTDGRVKHAGYSESRHIAGLEFQQIPNADRETIRGLIQPLIDPPA